MSSTINNKLKIVNENKPISEEIGSSKLLTGASRKFYELPTNVSVNTYIFKFNFDIDNIDNLYCLLY